MKSTLSVILCVATLVAVSRAGAQVCVGQSLPPDAAGGPPRPLAEVYGTVERIDGTTMILVTRVGRRLRIDLTPASAAGRVQAVQPGMAAGVLATQGSPSMLLAQSVARAKASPAAWRPDCIPFAGF